MKMLINLFLCLFSILLSGCGGGGAGGGNEINYLSPTLNLKNAWDEFKRQSGSVNYTINGNINGVNVSGNGQLIIAYASPDQLLTINPAASFPGPSVTQINLSRTLLEFVSNVISTGGAAKIYSTENWYYDSTGQLKVIWNVDDNEQTIVTNFSPFPTSVTSGNAGNMFTGTIFSRLGYTCGTRNAVYTVTASSASSLMINIIDTSSTTQQQIGQCKTSKSVTNYTFILTGNLLTLKSVTGTGSSATGSITFSF